MASTDKARVFVSGGFTPGTKVGLADRHGDFPPRRLVANKTATVDKDATVTFTGLPEGQRYWVFSIDDEDRRALRATAKVQPDDKQRLKDADVRERLSQTRGGKPATSSNNPETRTTTVVLSAGGMAFPEHVGKPTPKDEQEHEPQPRLRQEDARNVDQRSATLTGSAHPVQPGEPQPKLSQQDIPDDTPQRSATPYGEATPIPKDEVAPAIKQEDAQALEQRSATETGRAELKPLGSAVEQAEARDGSVAASIGEDDPAPKESDTAGRKGPKAKTEVRNAVKRDVTGGEVDSARDQSDIPSRRKK